MPTEENDNHQDAAGAGAGDDGFKPITSQEDFERALGKRLAHERAKFADYDDLKAKAEKFDEIEKASKSELERIAEERDSFKKRADEQERNYLRMFVAHNFGLTPAQAKRLVGTTKEELEADAQEIMRDFPASATGQRTASRPSALKSGSSGSPDTGEKGRAAAALRSLRQG